MSGTVKAKCSQCPVCVWGRWEQSDQGDSKVQSGKGLEGHDEECGFYLDVSGGPMEGIEAERRRRAVCSPQSRKGQRNVVGRCGR